MKLKLFSILPCLLLGACATSRLAKYEVVAEPADSVIEVNGTAMCLTTPCQIALQCNIKFIGYAYSSSGYGDIPTTYRVTAVPKGSASKSLYSNTNNVNACNAPSDSVGKIYFNAYNQKANPVVEAAQIQADSDAQNRRLSDEAIHRARTGEAIRQAGQQIQQGFQPPKQTNCTSTPTYGGGFTTNCK